MFKLMIFGIFYLLLFIPGYEALNVYRSEGKTPIGGVESLTNSVVRSKLGDLVRILQDGYLEYGLPNRVGK